MTRSPFTRTAGAIVVMVGGSVLFSGCAVRETPRPAFTGEDELHAPVVVVPLSKSSVDSTNRPTPLASIDNQVIQAPERRASRLQPQSFRVEMFKHQQRYDDALRSRVNERWRSLLNAASAAEQTGAVTIRFRLFEDGHISELQVIKSTANDQFRRICERAILESAPFDPYPGLTGGSTNAGREISFDFKYE